MSATNAPAAAGGQQLNNRAPDDDSAPPDWQTLWQMATTAAALVAVHPRGLGGVVVRAPAGVVRDAWLAFYLGLLGDEGAVKRVPGNISDSRLLGGLDLASTLASGKPVAETGVLAECDGGVAIFPMAERMSVTLAAKIAAVLDNKESVVERDGFQLRHATAFTTILLDEGIDDEAASAAIVDRMAFHVDLTGVPPRLLVPGSSGELCAIPVSKLDIAAAHACMPDVVVSDDALAALVSTAMALGADGLRAPLLAVGAARAIAALNGRQSASEDDVQLAARLVIAPRATRLPSTPTEAPPEESAGEDNVDDEPPQEPPQPPENEPEEPQPTDDKDQSIPDVPLEDAVIAAAAASIPEKLLLQMMMNGGSRRSPQSAGQSGQLRNGAKRGRVIGAVRGDIRSGARLNVLATLRAAAPWQRVRGASLSSVGDGRRLQIRKDDFRINRFQQRAETTTIFVLDASGSSALHRLAEAKGAIELMLADCYIRRDRVSVISFRGKSAELLLAPTRSLVRAKRGLSALPGGGGTPLAAGIDAARELAEGLTRRGDTVVLVMLTDGRANVSRAGVGDRVAADADALAAARSVRAIGLQSILIDTSPTANARAAAVSAAMGARYVTLPHAGARTLRNAVDVATSLAGGVRGR